MTLPTQVHLLDLHSPNSVWQRPWAPTILHTKVVLILEVYRHYKSGRVCQQEALVMQVDIQDLGALERLDKEMGQHLQLHHTQPLLAFL